MQPAEWHRRDGHERRLYLMPPAGAIPLLHLHALQHHVRKDCRLKGKMAEVAEMLLYLMWQQHHRSKRKLWYAIVSQEWLAKRCQCSVRTVGDAVRRLRERRWITTRQLRRPYPKPPGPNLYSASKRVYAYLRARLGTGRT